MADREHAAPRQPRVGQLAARRRHEGAEGLQSVEDLVGSAMEVRAGRKRRIEGLVLEPGHSRQVGEHGPEHEARVGVSRRGEHGVGEETHAEVEAAGGGSSRSISSRR
jgi:hypothetical protein